MASRRLDLWLPSYLLGAPARRWRRWRTKGTRHILFLICDHFEPRHGIDHSGQDVERVSTWTREYPAFRERCRQAFGHAPKHTWFYPPHHGLEHLAPLGRLSFEGAGEVELHYHHHDDDSSSLREGLRRAIEAYQRHGLLSESGVPPRTAFAFVHGDWALDNAGGRFCGVNDELTILQELGCWGDFTMPSANECQTRKVNSIYYAVDDPQRPKSHDWGRDARVGRTPSGGLFMLQGPLALNWRSKRLRIENASLTTANWGRPDRVHRWLDCHVHVRGRPEWVFVKLHAHGAVEEDHDALFGERAFDMHRTLNEQFNDGVHYRLHYVTAREAYNIAKAAEAGHAGDPSAVPGLLDRSLRRIAVLVGGRAPSARLLAGPAERRSSLHQSSGDTSAPARRTGAGGRRRIRGRGRERRWSWVAPSLRPTLESTGPGADPGGDDRGAPGGRDRLGRAGPRSPARRASAGAGGRRLPHPGLMELAFWLASLLIAYPPVLYPLVMGVLGRLWPQRIDRRPFWPEVSLLVPAHNEAGTDPTNHRNKLSLDYPRERLQIIVVSDGSVDGTDEIVRGFGDQGVELLRQEPRRGKAAALNAAVKRSRGEILVFSDANSVYAADTVRLLVENFSDARVGYVTGTLSYRDDSGNVSGSGIRAYMAYEGWVRRMESRFGSIIGVNGGVDAMRRHLYFDVPEDLITDFVLPLHVMQQGYRVVYDERASAVERANAEIATEFRMRVRVALRSFRGLAHMGRLLNPLLHPRAAFCLWSHKVLRYCTPALLLVALLSSLTLARGESFYAWAAAGQLVGYVLGGLALGGRLPPVLRRPGNLAGYFLLTNAAFAVAFLKWLRGDRMATWKPRGG